MTRAQHARLERLRALAAPATGGVLRCLPGESVEQAIERAGREGRTGQFMVMPAIPSPEQWEAEAAANQQRLLERARVYMRDGFKNIGESSGTGDKSASAPTRQRPALTPTAGARPAS